MVKFDIVVFGATGFTGKYIVEVLIRVCEKHPYSDLTWAVAGRSKQKLDLLIKEHESLAIPIILADVKDENSLKEMVGSAKVLLNCTGPYTVLGEPVVKACINAGTHYVDMTAELHFMLSIFEKYNKSAEEANVLVVPACGFASVPASMGMVALENHFKGTLLSVETYVKLDIPSRVLFPGCCSDNCLVHYGTWSSLVHELHNLKKYREAKLRVYNDNTYDELNEKCKRGFLHRSNGKVWFPYPGPDDNVIEFTERYRHKQSNKPPIAYHSYTTTPWLIHLLIIPVFMLYYLLSNFKCFRTLLWRFPKFFTLGYISHDGPSRRTMQDMGYSFLLKGKGSAIHSDGSVEESQINVEVSGVNPYEATAIAFVLSAITIVKEESHMPKGGVLASGAAFCDTKLIERLHTNGMKIETFENS